MKRAHNVPTKTHLKKDDLFNFIMEKYPQKIDLLILVEIEIYGKENEVKSRKVWKI